MALEICIRPDAALPDAQGKTGIEVHCSPEGIREYRVFANANRNDATIAELAASLSSLETVSCLR